MYSRSEIRHSCFEQFNCYWLLFAVLGLFLLRGGKQLMDVTSSPALLLPSLYNKRALGIRNNGFECGEFHAPLLAGQTTNSPQDRKHSLEILRCVV